MTIVASKRRKHGKRRAAIDPGTRKIGWAVESLSPGGLIYGGITVTGDDWVQRSMAILKAIGEEAPAVCWADEVIIEMPRVWNSPTGTQAALSGSTMKLMWFVGMLTRHIMAWSHGNRVGLLGAGVWQGGMAKALIYKRMARHYGPLEFPSDEAHWDISDAIGILHYSRADCEEDIQWVS